MGYYPVVSDKENYIIVSPFKDEEGDWRDTGCVEELESAEKLIGSWDGWSQEVWEKKEQEGYKIIGFHRPPRKRFKVGDKVRIREDLKDLQYDDNWSDTTPKLYQNTAGKVGVIKGSGGLAYSVYFAEFDEWYYYSQAQLEPYIKIENTKPQTINIGGKEYEVTEELTEALKNLKEIN